MPDTNLNEINKVTIAPHISSGDSVTRMMWLTAFALLPAALYSVYAFGMKTALAYLVSVSAAVAADFIAQLVTGRRLRAYDGSAAITGLLVVMVLPAGLPLWLPAAGSAFAVLVAKQVFGGLGVNLFNPAMAGRMFMLLAWPAYVRTGWSVSQSGSIDASRLTWYAMLPQEALDRLAGIAGSQTMPDTGRLVLDYNGSFSSMYDFFVRKNVLKSLFMGNAGGNTGDIALLLIILGGLFLLWKKIISWHIPFSFIGSLAAASYLYYHFRGISYPGFMTLLHIATGGVILGAVFIATDPVTSPLTPRGMFIFGSFCGLITFAVRIFGWFPEGVTESILVMNAAVPLIDRFVRPSVFGLPGKSQA